MPTQDLALQSVLDACSQLSQAGAALHWLVPQQKNPIDKTWASAPVQRLADLEKSHRPNANIGIRLGEPSKTDAGYIHLIDLDIRDASKADEAHAALRELFPGYKKLPTVISGSRGESRHFYFICPEPFRKTKVAKSAGHKTVFDKRLNRDVKKNDWEIDVMGTGSQAVIPPSIHPDTGLPYVWEREFDFFALELGRGPIIDAETVSEWGVASAKELTFGDDEDDLLAEWKSSPLELTQDEIDAILRDLPGEWVEDRDAWYQVGMALHHQYRGDPKAFEIWCEWSQQSDKYDPKTQKTVWKSFKGDKKPVTMRTLIQAANDERLKDALPEFDEAATDHEDRAEPGKNAIISDALADMLGDPEPKIDPLQVLLGDEKPVKSALDELLGDGIPEEKAPNLPAETGSDDDFDENWTSLLDRNDEGKPKGVLHNIKLIVRNDLRLRGILALNEFTQEIVLINKPKRVEKRRDSAKTPVNLTGHIWGVDDPVNGKMWTDSHDHDLRAMIEAPKTQGGYGLKVTDRDLKAAVDSVANLQRFHPVREYLNACADNHDGVFGRAETLFTRYLNAPDTPYHRGAARLELLGAVVRAFEPGHKFDFVVILEGLQGKRKSTFISILARHWFSELTGDFHNTAQMVEAIQGSWIIEIPELQGFSRADTNMLKGFISRQVDKARLAYDRRPRNFPRQCVFVGSTNEDEYLRDHTGGRRFWPVHCNLGEEDTIDTDALEAEIDMVWGEVVLMYRELREKIKLKSLPLYLSDADAISEAKSLQESRRIEQVEDNLAGAISAWLDKPLGPADEKDDLNPDAPQRVRNATCTAQIWCEMMGRDIGQLGQAESIRIGKAFGRLDGWTKCSVGQVRTKKYGRQRVMLRKGCGLVVDTVQREL